MDFEREAAKGWHLPDYGPPRATLATSLDYLNEPEPPKPEPKSNPPPQNTSRVWSTPNVRNYTGVPFPPRPPQPQPWPQTQAQQNQQRQFQQQQYQQKQQRQHYQQQKYQHQQQQQQQQQKQQQQQRKEQRPPIQYQRGGPGGFVPSRGPRPHPIRYPGSLPQIPPNSNANQKRVPVNIGKDKWIRGKDPDDAIQLPELFFKATLATTQSSASTNTSAVPNNPMPIRSIIYGRISEETGTFIKPAEHGRFNLVIWGDKASIARAKASLSRRVEDILKRMPPRPSVDDPTPLQAQRTSSAILELRKEPPIHRERSKFMFLWTQDGPSLKKCFGDDLEDLDFLRKEYQTYIYIQPGVDDYICISSDKEFDSRAIVERLRELWQEMCARFNMRVKVYMVQPPNTDSMADKVEISKQHGAAQAVLYKVHSDQLLPKAKTPQNKLAGLAAANDQRIRKGLERGLMKIKYIPANMRLRVKFGTFILDRWKTVSGGSTVYPLHEFPEMLRDDRWQGRLVPGLNLGQKVLLQRLVQSGEFVELKDNTKKLSSIGKMKVLQSVTFEFARGENCKNTLRLDVNFNTDIGTIETGSAQHIWQQARAGSGKQPHLQLSMMDFERSDWQLELEFMEKLSEDDLSAAQRKFADSVKLDPIHRGAPMTSKPGRKIFFQENVLISKFIQKTAVRCKIKGTEYVLEVAKFEEFKYSSKGYTRWTRPGVFWGAMLINPRWQRLLGDHSRNPEKVTIESLFQSGATHHTGEVGDGHGKGKAPSLSRDQESKRESASQQIDSNVKELLLIVKRIAKILSPLPQSGEKPFGEDEDEEVDGDTAGVLDAELGTLF